MLLSRALSRAQGSTWMQLQKHAAMSSTSAAATTTSAPALELKPWTPESKRTGLLAVKQGCMHIYDDWGMAHPVTVLQVEECQVTQVKTKDVHGFSSIQLGVGLRKERNVTKPVLGHLAKAGVPAKRELHEFRVSDDALIPAGTTLNALHFSPGQYVDVCGKSKGKGFQGVMKRHNFAGQPASHGNSLAHRAMGSAGQCQDPGKVWKGKKMPGRMGNKRVTRDNLWILKIDPQRNLLYVKGSVPGAPGGVVRVTDARKKKFDEAATPPFPTFVLAKGESLPPPTLAPKAEVDPYNYEEQ
ncbi:50S ribosomal protein L3 [Aphanomyces invadans]|uniref:Large ribosomal subunit protein uL3m n=1 Tax=Aphanomyces invadans TaxID=157072 RepID=A0A024U2L8_9STRA|nr:50S ribosomal protein L3 [Aphanomyces invadans]ETW00440.1 50S ribosomal protein L3 [Aphanomyces invadans]|eukprot:XP_008870575.1 50S ribosomal protein L3 [Aphanomyces invadans]